MATSSFVEKIKQIQDREFPVHYVRDFAFLLNFFDQEALQIHDQLSWVGPANSGLDLETEVLNGPKSGLFPRATHIASAQIELNGEVWVVHWDADRDVVDVPCSYLFRAYLECESVEKNIQNAVFEHGHLLWSFREWSQKRQTWVFPLHMGPVFDTMLAEYDLAQGRNTTDEAMKFIPITRDLEEKEVLLQKLDLGSLIKRWFGVTLDKGEDVRLSFKRGPDGSMSGRQQAYAADDAYWTTRLRRSQEKFFDEKVRRVFKLDCEYTEALARMWLEGIPCDVSVWENLSQEWAQEIQALEDYLKVEFAIPGDGSPVLTPKTGKQQIKKGKPLFQLIKLGSDKDMPARLNYYGFPVLSYEAHELKKFSSWADPLFEGDYRIDALLRWKTLTHNKNNYADKLPLFVHPETKCIHVSPRNAKTATGRISIDAPPLQQMPKRTETGVALRGGFKARPGWKLVKADFSNIEMRLIAWIFNDPVMRQAFRDNLDMHILTGAKIHYNVLSNEWHLLMEAYKKLEDRLKNKDTEAKHVRQSAKPSNFGLGYGAGDEKYQSINWVQYDRLISLEKSHTERTQWRELFAGVAKHHRKIGKLLTQKGGLLCPESSLGRRRWVRGYSAAINHPIQSTSGEITKASQVRLCRDVTITLVIHDEFIAHVPEDEAEWTAEYMKVVMEEEGQKYLGDIPCVVDMEICDAWGE